MNNLSIIKRTLILLSICFVLFIIFKGIDIMILTALTSYNLTSLLIEYGGTHIIATTEVPFIVQFIILILQGMVIFLASFLIIRKKKYDMRYWVPALLMVLMIHTMMNPNFYYAQNFMMYSIYVILAILVGLLSIYLSTKIRTEKR